SSPTTYFNDTTPYASLGAVLGQVAVGDVDNDGLPDIAIAGRDLPQALAVYHNTGSGFSAMAMDTTVVLSSAVFAWADLDQKNVLGQENGSDLIVSGRDVNAGQNVIFWMPNKGNALGAAVPILNTRGIAAGGLAAGDLYGNHVDDLVVSGNGNDGKA